MIEQFDVVGYPGIREKLRVAGTIYAQGLDKSLTYDIKVHEVQRFLERMLLLEMLKGYLKYDYLL